MWNKEKNNSKINPILSLYAIKEGVKMTELDKINYSNYNPDLLVEINKYISED